MARTIVVDIATMYYRSFYSLPDTIVSPKGEPINAIRGTLEALFMFIDRYQPSNIITCWDYDWRPDWRVELIDSYKTARTEDDGGSTIPDSLSDQVEILHDLLIEIGMPVVGIDGFESDDIVSHFARQISEPVDIVSGDKDLFQLIDDSVQNRVLYIGTGFSKHTQVDDTYLLDRYGIKGSQYGDFSVLRGDASDGLPGVKGIGEKTASALIAEFGTLDDVLKAATRGDSRIKPKVTSSLLEHSDYIERAKEVVLLNKELDLAIPKVKPVSATTIVEELGLQRQLSRWQQLQELFFEV
jgi:5'-3' exonuclease